MLINQPDVFEEEHLNGKKLITKVIDDETKKSYEGADRTGL